LWDKLAVLAEQVGEEEWRSVRGVTPRNGPLLPCQADRRLQPNKRINLTALPGCRLCARR
jgi:hypothetical protein